MEKRLDKNETQQSIFSKSLFAGAVGAFIWGLIGSIAFFFNFTQTSHASFIVRSFFTGPWTEGITGELISLLILTILGIFPALIYYVLLKKTNGILPGIMFGIALWAGVYLLLQPMFAMVPSIVEMKVDSIITDLCLFILYGVFVGYTISYEHHEDRITASKNSQNET